MLTVSRTRTYASKMFDDRKHRRRREYRSCDRHASNQIHKFSRLPQTILQSKFRESEDIYLLLYVYIPVCHGYHKDFKFFRESSERQEHGENIIHALSRCVRGSEVIHWK